MPSKSNEPSGKQKSGRGFAGMDEEKQRDIASKGGKAAHESGRAHEFSPEEAQEAGRKGGQASKGGQTGQEGRQPSQGGKPSRQQEERPNQ